MPSLRPDDIVCFEVGSGDVPAWIGSRRALEDDWPAIERQAARGVIQLDVSGDAVTIRGATRVGLVVLPSGRRLVVRSKIPSLKLLEWLAYLGEFPRLTAWLSDAGVGVGDDWHQCLARLFLRALEHVTQRHVRKDYVSIAADRPEIRGRILTAALGRRLHRLPRVPQIQRQRTLDTPFNIVLALTLDRLPAMLPDASDADRRRMARLREQWASISRHSEDPASAVTAAQWACPPGYRDALQLARLILAGASLDSDSHMGGQSFTLPLAAVWEHAVRRMCDDLADSYRLAPRERCPTRAALGRPGRPPRSEPLADRRRDRPASRLAVGARRQVQTRVRRRKPRRPIPDVRLRRGLRRRSGHVGLPDRRRRCHDARTASHDRRWQTPADRLAGLAHGRRPRSLPRGVGFRGNSIRVRAGSDLETSDALTLAARPSMNRAERKAATAPSSPPKPQTFVE